MNLADYIRPLLRDHDCVIIPDFGGLVADAAPARRQPGRHVFSPPSKLVAFNQALTRNDGLLVDALRQHLGLPANEARETLRRAVETLRQELADTNRTELPGIGIFRRAAGRGLAFEYTGTDNLLPAAYGLPELAARPVLGSGPREQAAPALRSARPRRLVRAVSATAAALVVGLVLSANYLGALQAGYLPEAWQLRLPHLEFAARPAAPLTIEPQQASLGQPDFSLSPSVPVPSEAGLTAVVPAAGLSAVTDRPAEAAPATPAATIVAASPANATTSLTTPSPDAALSNSKVVAAASSAAVVPAATPATPAPESKPVVLAPVASSTINRATGRYYVIAGAYSTLAHAQKGRQVLLKAGRNARVILPMPGSRLFRLTSADYADLASAEREAQRLRISTRCDYNTLKY